MQQALKECIKDGLNKGLTKPDLHQALRDAGWPEEELAAFWNAHHDAGRGVLIPRPAAYVSPRLVALNLFYFLVLYLAIYSAISIVFTLLDQNLPNGLGEMGGMYYSVQPFADAIREYLALLIVCVPLIYTTHRALQKGMQATGQFLSVPRLKLMSITLFIAALIALGNAVSFLYYFLSGELSLRFFLKVIVLLSVSAATYSYFKPEIARAEKKG